MQHGFVRDPEDIKFLIMFSMSFMPFAIGENDILDTVMVDGAFGYFEFSEAFQGLMDTKHIAMLEKDGEKQYILTPRGQQMIADMYRELPSSVRDKAEKAAMRTVMKIRRENTLKTEVSNNPDGTFTVKLVIADGEAEHLRIEMLAMTRRQCSIMSEAFKDSAEEIYSRLIQLLSQATDKREE